MTYTEKEHQWSCWSRAVMVFVVLAVGLAWSADAQAKQEQYKFTNNTGQHANDIHIEFNKGSLQVTDQFPDNTFPADDSADGRSTINMKEGLTGTGVNNGSSFVITVQYSGTTPEVKSVQWTNGNTLEPESGDYLGNPMMAQNMSCFWSPDPAAGDGLCFVTVDNVTMPFNTNPGEPGSQTAQRFALLIESMEFGEVLTFDADAAFVQCTGQSYFEFQPNIMIEIVQQDSQQWMEAFECEMLLHVENLVAGQYAQFVVESPQEGAVVAVVYGTALGSTSVDGVSGYCAEFGIRGVRKSKLIGQGPIIAGVYLKEKRIPGNVSGLEVHFQAAMRDTCPGSCTSNIVTALVAE